MNINKQTLFAIALLGSLAFNVFLGGFILGKFLGHPHPPHGERPPNGGMPPPEFAIMRELSPESRDKVRPFLKAHKEAMQPEFRKMQQAQQAVFDQLTAETFNADTLAAAFTQLQQERGKIQEIMSQFVINAAGQLSQDERLILAKSVRRGPGGMGGSPGDMPPPPPPPPPID